MATGRIRKEVIDKMAALLTAAFGLVAALAWNGAIQQVFHTYAESAKDSIFAMFLYAIIITILAVIITIWIGRVADRAKGHEEKVKEAKEDAKEDKKNTKKASKRK